MSAMWTKARPRMATRFPNVSRRWRARNMPRSEERAPYAQLGLMTQKPVMYVCNVDEGSAAHGNAFSKRVEEMARAQHAEIGRTRALCSAWPDDAETRDVCLQCGRRLGRAWQRVFQTCRGDGARATCRDRKNARPMLSLA